MRILFLAVLAAASLYAADERKLALESAAQADFDRVTATAAPDLAIATKCVQSQAMLLAVATPQETAPIVFRRAYCALASAAATQDHAGFIQASELFDDAIADAGVAPLKEKLLPTVPSTWRIFAAIARLNGGESAESQRAALSTAVDARYADEASCQIGAAAMEFCHSVHQLGSAWLGWIALGAADLPAAERRFAESNTPPWTQWTAGLNSFHNGNYTAAAADYSRAIEIWRGQSDSLTGRLAPQPVMSNMLTEWAGAQLAVGDAEKALANLEAAVRADGSNERAFYLRGVAKQRLGRKDAATDDYNLAARAAFAKTGETGASEAHFYRGLALYGRKDFPRAESEFDGVLNADSPSPWQADVRAWRYLAAVAGGACGASRSSLDRALASVSPYFPKEEARTASAACPTTAASLPIR